MSTYSLLSLGDSYTVGEGVAIHENFPYQLIQLLRESGLKFHAPEIVAKTGWTTFELKDYFSHTLLNEEYDFVTLLIGVNNQYQGLSAEDYKRDFELLLSMTLKLTKKPERVIVLSIPDWGATPFAEGRDRNKITREIDEFNSINKEISKAYNTSYIDIATVLRQAGINETSVAADKLHYSGKEYKKWAQQVADKIEDLL